jgi:hypothetical protein
MSFLNQNGGLFRGFLRGIAIGRRSTHACKQGQYRSHALLVSNDVGLRVVGDLKGPVVGETAKMLQKNRERAHLVVQLDIFDGAVCVKLVKE